MYLIDSAKDYEKSYNKLKKSGAKDSVLEDLDTAIDILASGGTLGKEYRDHQLKGDFKEYRECKSYLAYFPVLILMPH